MKVHYLNILLLVDVNFLHYVLCICVQMRKYYLKVKTVENKATYIFSLFEKPKNLQKMITKTKKFFETLDF